MKLLIFKNNTMRFLKGPAYLFIAALVLIVMTAATAFAVTMKAPKVDVGVSTSASELLQAAPIEKRQLVFTKVTDSSDITENLIMGKYDAYVSKKAGHYTVTSVRSSALKRQLTAYLNNGTYSKVAGSGTHHFKIFLSMLGITVMMLSLILYKFYFDDCAGIDQRIYLSGLSHQSYLLQHIIFNAAILICLSIPITAFILPLFGIKLSGTLFATIPLVCIFASTFGIMIATLTRTKQGAMGIGTILVVLSFMLSGALFSIKKATLQARLQYLFPQHYIATLGKYLDGARTLGSALIMLPIFTIICVFTALIAQKKRSIV